MTKDPRIYLDDILESILKIEDYMQGVTEEEFLKNTEKQDAVLRRLLVVGEAVKNTPTTLREKYPHVPWREIAGTRDKLVHEYFDVKMKRVWKFVCEDLPKLKVDILKIKSDFSQ